MPVFLARVQLDGPVSGYGLGLFALALLPLIYAALCVAVTCVRRRRQARWLDR